MALKNENGVAKIVLTNFIGSKVIEVEDDYGRPQKGVFIPLDMNDLRVTFKGKVNCYAFVTKTVCPEQYGWSHFLKLKARPDFCKKLKELGYDTPYLGNFKYQNNIAYKYNYKKSLVKNTEYGI